MASPYLSTTRQRLGALSLGIAVFIGNFACTPLAPADDSRLYLAYSTGPSGNPLALLQGNTLASIPLFANRSATDVSAVWIGGTSGPRLYATLDGAPGAFVVVQTGTNVVLANLAVGNQPAALAVNEDATRAYVVNAAAHTVSVINLLTNTVVATVVLPNGSRPTGVTVDSAGDIWILNRDAENVTVLDGGSNLIEAVIPLGAVPADLALTEDGSQLWVSHPAAGMVTIIDALSRTMATSISGLTNPQGMVARNYFAPGMQIAVQSGGTGASSVGYYTTTLQPVGPAPPTQNPDGGIRIASSTPNANEQAMIGRAGAIYRSGRALKDEPGTVAAGLSYVRVVDQAAPSQTVTTNPAGLRVRVDGVEFQSPAKFNWVAGSAHTISVTAQQGPTAGARYLWTGWNNGGALVQTITVPAGSPTYTASFRTQFEVTTATIPQLTGGAMVTRSPNAVDNYYDSGTKVTFTAAVPASSGLIFGIWQGNLTSDDNPESLVIVGPGKVTALFDSAPQIGFNITARGPQANSGYLHTTSLRNFRNEAYTNLQVTAIKYSVEQGTGTLSNTTSVPVSLGSMAANASTTAFPVTATIPATVTQWNVTLSGTVKNAAGRTLAWTASGVVTR